MLAIRIMDKIKYLFYSYTKNNIEYAKFLGVTIGENCRIYTRDFGSEPWLIEIGDKVTVTNGVRFINHDGATWLVGDEKGRRQLFRRIIIGNNVFIGMDVIILPGVKIGNNVIIAAGSVVTKSIPSGYVVGGSPAKFIMDFDAYKERALEHYITQDEMDGTKNYKDRVLKVVDNSFKNELKRQS